MLRTSLASHEEYYERIHINTVIVVSDLADVLWALSECDSAGLMYERAYRDSVEFYGSDHPHTLGHKREFDRFRMKMEDLENEKCERKDYESEESRTYNE